MTDPGTRWEYGTNIDFVGKAVEAVSGKRLDAYLRDHLFAPLGMTDTGFKIGDAQRQRLVGMHARGEDGSLAPIPFELEQDPEFHMGGGGLYGTAGDYIKFTQMILNKGRGNGNQVLKPETVAMMGQNHIGELNMTKMTSAVAFATNDVDLYPDMDKKWGLSFLINTAKTPEGRSPGSLAWAGLANTYYWIDPARDVTGVILMQVLPFADKQMPGSVRRLRARRLCRAGCGAEGGVSSLLATPCVHGRACPGHPRSLRTRKTWMPGTSPGMTSLKTVALKSAPTPATRSSSPVPSATPAAARRCAGSLRPRRARRAGRHFHGRRRAPGRTGIRRRTGRRRRWCRPSFESETPAPR